MSPLITHTLETYLTGRPDDEFTDVFVFEMGNGTVARHVLEVRVVYIAPPILQAARAHRVT